MHCAEGGPMNESKNVVVIFVRFDVFEVKQRIEIHLLIKFVAFLFSECCIGTDETTAFQIL